MNLRAAVKLPRREASRGRIRGGRLSLSILSCLVVAAVFGPLLSPKSPTMVVLPDRLKPPVWFGGTWAHPLGTDDLGRDEFARLLAGARVSLTVGLSVVVLAAIVGLTVGLIAGYREGRLGWLLMRIVDIGLALPGLLVTLVILAFLGPSERLVIIVLALESWLSFARLSRALAVGLKSEGYIEAAELGGISPRRIVLRHLLPNALPPVLTMATLEFARVVLQEASLSYLGYGVQPPGVSWGLMVASGQAYVSVAWWLVFMPGVALALTVLAVNRLQVWLRRRSDPSEFVEIPTIGRSLLGIGRSRADLPKVAS